MRYRVLIRFLLSVGPTIGLIAASSVFSEASQEDAFRLNEARELSPQEVREVLGLSKEFAIKLEGKSRMDKDRMVNFQRQFGRLPNGLPTFQIKPGVYFVLMPLGELDKQPLLSMLPRNAPREKVGELCTDSSTDPSSESSQTPPKVDHRSGQTPIRDQGQRGTCVAFAACADIEARLVQSGKMKSDGADLSENHAYHRFMFEEGSTPCKDPGLATWKAAGYLRKHLVGFEQSWQYVSTSVRELQRIGKCDLIDKVPGAVSGTAGCGIDEFMLLPAGDEEEPDGSTDIKDTLTLERLLQSGNDIVFGTYVAWSSGDETGIIDVTLGPAGQPIFGSGGHAMLIIGYDRSGNKPYFIVKNSWGAGQGHAGYYFFSYDYMRAYAKYGYVTKQLRTGTIP